MHAVVLAAHPFFFSTDLLCCLLQPDLAVTDVAAEQHIRRNAVRSAVQLHGTDFGKIRQRFTLLFRQFIEYQMIRCLGIGCFFETAYADTVQHENHCNDRNRSCNADRCKGGLPFLCLDITGSKQAFISHCSQPPPAKNAPRLK